MKRIFTTTFFNLIVICLSSPSPGLAQKTLAPDSLNTRQVIATDSSANRLHFASPLTGDQSSGKPQTKPGRIQPADTGIDSKVTYSARKIDSRKDDGIIYLLGDAKVTYKKIIIEAGQITINMKKNLLLAEALPDSAVAGINSGKVKNRGFPKFSDGGEGMTGERMEYNFKTEKGRIQRGRTNFEKGYYFGDTVKRVDADVFFVKEGRYSTCDKDEPHFHFRGKKMKVIANDKVLAKPVVFFLGKIPLAIFPFAMFPAQESGRQSGIILPQYGSSPSEGRYLRNMGYYWATNDYLDMQFTLDFFERTGILFRGNLRYALRYKYSGGVSGSFTHKNFPNGQRQRFWNLRVNHTQNFDESTRLVVNADLQNNKTFYRELSDNRDERLRRNIISNATLTKRWGVNNMTLNVKHTKDVASGKEELTLPQFNFTRGRSALIPFNDDESARSKTKPKWFNQIFYNYSMSLTNIMKDDTTDSPPEDVRKANHNLSFSYTPRGKLFGVIGLNQSFNYTEDWLNNRKENFTRVDSTNSFNSDKKKGFFRRYKYSYNLSASTNLYGTFPGVAAIKAFRHKMSPSVGFSYSPDFKDKYYVTLLDTNNVAKDLDKFQGSPKGKTMSMNFRLNNLFQMKLGKGDKERVVKLFDLNFSSRYNFAAKQFKLSNLSTSVLANPTKTLRINMNMSHSFYRFDDSLGTRVDEFIKPRLTSLRFDARWSLQGSQAKKTAGSNSNTNQASATPVPITQLGRQVPQASGDYEDTFAPKNAFSALDIPWRANLSFSYSINKNNPNFTQKTAYFDLSNVELQITQNWRIGYSLRYDLEKTEVVDQRLSFYRDLHCWEARFDWSPSGFGKGYYFIINVKASHLKQLKIERRGGTTTIFNPFN